MLKSQCYLFSNPALWWPVLVVMSLITLLVSFADLCLRLKGWNQFSAYTELGDLHYGYTLSQLLFTHLLLLISLALLYTSVFVLSRIPPNGYRIGILQGTSILSFILSTYINLAILTTLLLNQIPYYRGLYMQGVFEPANFRGDVLYPTSVYAIAHLILLTMLLLGSLIIHLLYYNKACQIYSLFKGVISRTPRTS